MCADGGAVVVGRAAGKTITRSRPFGKMSYSRKFVTGRKPWIGRGRSAVKVGTGEVAIDTTLIFGVVASLAFIRYSSSFPIDDQMGHAPPVCEISYFTPVGGYGWT